jgi:hypothetical protein
MNVSPAFLKYAEHAHQEFNSCGAARDLHFSHK